MGYSNLEVSTVTDKARYDIGHGGPDPGALGNGLQEAEVVLEVGKLAAACTRAAGVTIDLTRVSDVGLTPEQRTALAVQPANCVVSIHANAATDTSARGVEVFVSNTNAESQRLGSLIAEKYLARVIGIPARTPVVKTRLRPEGDDYYYIIRKPTEVGIPAVLVEIGFVTNYDDAQVLRSFWGRFAIAFAIYEGVAAWLGLDSGTAELMMELARKDAVLEQIEQLAKEGGEA